MSPNSNTTAAKISIGLPPPRRVITTHDANGKAVISTQISQEVPRFEIPGMHFYLGYTLGQSPAILDNDQDLVNYESQLPHNLGISIPGGTVLRIVDFLPGEGLGPMHRTKTVDFGVIIEGELEIILDSGESTVLKRGDIIVQRGTIHAWRNNSTTRVARGFFVLADATLPTIHGEKLGEYVPVEELKTE